MELSKEKSDSTTKKNFRKKRVLGEVSILATPEAPFYQSKKEPDVTYHYKHLVLKLKSDIYNKAKLISKIKGVKPQDLIEAALLKAIDEFVNGEVDKIVIPENLSKKYIAKKKRLLKVNRKVYRVTKDGTILKKPTFRKKELAPKP